MAQFHVHVDAIVRHGDEILIMKRAMGFMSGAWYFPGGQLEQGESPEEGARREIKEETELEVPGLRLFKVWTYQLAGGEYALGITFTCEVPPDTEPRINEEHLAARWVAPSYYRDRFLNDEILEPLRGNPAASVAFAVRDVVDAYIQARGAEA